MVINKVSNKNKIIVAIVMMLMLLISTLKINTYARTSLDVPLPQHDGYWFMVEITTKSGVDEGDKQYKFYTSNKKMLYNPTSNKIEGQDIKMYILFTEHSDWEFSDIVQEVGNINGESTGTPHYKYELINSNYTIYHLDETTVFFSKMSIFLDYQQTLTQMSHQIVGITPFLIGLLIALVGFWKAWQFLFKTLRKA